MGRTYAERLPVPEARPGSWEALLHWVSASDRLLLFEGARDRPDLAKQRGHRAIGVVYNPEYEAFGNYVPTALPSRYDAFIHLDETQALHPLHIQPKQVNPPATYPWGL
jgi:erythromycin esterase-like protein